MTVLTIPAQLYSESSFYKEAHVTRFHVLAMRVGYSEPVWFLALLLYSFFYTPRHAQAFTFDVCKNYGASKIKAIAIVMLWHFRHCFKQSTVNECVIGQSQTWHANRNARKCCVDMQAAFSSLPSPTPAINPWPPKPTYMLECTPCAGSAYAAWLRSRKRAITLLLFKFKD